MAVFQCASSATRWLVAAAAACLLGAGQVAGRSHSHRVARHGPPRPADRADDAGTTYFARHGLSPPPPIFRRELEGIADDGTQSFVDHNARLRHDLLRGHDEAFDFQFYDKHSYPWDYVWHNVTSGGSGGVPVEANINAVRPLESRRLGEAPFLTNSLTMSVCPLKAASITAERFCSLAELTSKLESKAD